MSVLQGDFRRALKDRTASHHTRVDRAISSIDITSRDGLARFLTIHRSCFAEMARVAPRDGRASTILRDMLECIDADLRVLSACQMIPRPRTLRQIDDLALDYVIEGSRLGTKVLRRNWATARDPIVQQAGAYFTMDADPDRWRAVCKALSTIAVESSLAQKITDDTRELFDLFYTAAHDSAPQERDKEAIF